MDKVNAKIGTDYKPFNYYGDPEATEIIVAMGSVCEAAEELVDYLRGKGKRSVSSKYISTDLSPQKYLLNVMPKTVKKIAVLDRTKEPGGVGEPLFLDVVSALRGTEFENCLIVGGRYGLSSKDTQPGDILAVYENLWSDEPKKEFTISIIDDVTGLSLTPSEYPDVAPEGTKACKFWGLGADGTVGANKNSVKIIGDHTDKKVQAYFQYDSKKSGGLTISHLRFGDEPIRSTYYVKQADFVACHNSAYIYKYDMVQDVKPGGFFLLNCVWNDEELDKHLPGKVKRYIARNNIKFYTCDAVSIAKDIGLGARRTNTVLQAAFFKLAEIIPIDDAVKYMKDAIQKTYGAKGEKIVNMNMQAVDAGVTHIHKVEIPASWADAEDDTKVEPMVGRDKLHTDYLNKILYTTNTMTGDNVPVSDFLDTATGMVPNGTAAYEKRGIAADVPHWEMANCIQCNMCSYVCPHGVIRPFVLDEKEAEPIKDSVLPMRGEDGKYFAIGISTMDCTGCGSCANVCPSKNKALTMHAVDDEYVDSQQKRFDYLFNDVTYKETKFKEDTVKGSQFKQPLMEFSGACPGCGESPYAKLITQLFGDRMFIANATGCSSIWGCSAPSTPYTVNKEGKGPAWGNSLFEDNAEFGLGMAISVNARRNELRSAAQRLADVVGAPAKEWLDVMDDASKAGKAGDAFAAACEALAATNEDAQFVVDNKDMLGKPSVWMFGGDGWAYDIGYGGLDHVLASGENVNIMVFDTEVYSNTGGQSSKATPIGAVAKFAASGKGIKKKDMVQIAMAYGYVYVAQIAMGADYNQTLKALREAESYDGPSLIIAYAPCINHGIKAGMDKSMDEMKHAVKSGYWNLLRYNPALKAEGKNPLILDSGEASESYRDFIMGEVRYNSLKLRFPERAEKLFEEAEEAAKERYETLVHRQKSMEE